MLIKSRGASCAFKLFIAIVGTMALVNSIGLFKLTFHGNFFLYFTNISNLATVLYYWCNIVQIRKNQELGQKPWLPKLKHTLMLGITVTGLVAYFLLDHGGVFKNGVFNPNNFVLHDLIPLCAVLDWLIFDEKPTMKVQEPLLWPLYPLAYFAYITTLVSLCGVRVQETTRWPYGFMDFDKLGIPTVLVTIGVLLVIFIIIGYIYVLIDCVCGKKASGQGEKVS